MRQRHMVNHMLSMCTTILGSRMTRISGWWVFTRSWAFMRKWTLATPLTLQVMIFINDDGGFGLWLLGSKGGIWKAVPLCLMWCLWREQNARCFEGQEYSVAKLKYLFLQSLLVLSFLFLCFTLCIQPMYLGSTHFSCYNELFTYKKIFITSNNLLLHWVTFLQILLQELLKLHYLYNQFQNLLFLFVHSLPITLLFMSLYLFGLTLCLFFTKHW